MQHTDIYHRASSERSRRRRLIRIGAWAMILLLALGAGVWLADRWAAPTATMTTGAGDAGGDSPAGAAPKPIPLVEAPQQAKGQPMKVGSQGAFPQPGGQGNGGQGNDGQQPEPPKNPCAGVNAADADKLIVAPDPLYLKSGATKGSLMIYNCGQQDIHWTALTKPWVSLADAAGVLAGKHEHQLGFTVDTSGLPGGAYTFKIKVSQPGHNVYVDVHGTKLGGFAAAPSPAPSVGGLTNGGPTGCAAQCIVKAWLTPIHGTPNVSLEVKTTTPAKLAALVDTTAPVKNGQDHPVFGDPDVSVHSGGAYLKKWTVTLKPLQPATKYHIVVWAGDANGGTSFRSGTLTTIKPITGLSAGQPGGCASNCVKSALLTPKPGLPGADVTVTTHVPTKLRLYADDNLPHKNVAGEPYFPGASPVASTGGAYKTQWSASLTLKHDTTYHVILKATDEQGRSQFHTGKLTTPPAPKADVGDVLVTFHKIHVSNDADDTFLNRTGELRFRFEVSGQRQSQLDTGERKVRSPEWVSLGDGDRGAGRSVVIEDAPDTLPIRVQGLERDGNKPGFCTVGSPMYDETSGRISIPKCYDMEWNTAAGTVDLAELADGGALPPCYGFAGITGDVCLLLKATGDDPTFDVYVTIDFL